MIKMTEPTPTPAPQPAQPPTPTPTPQAAPGHHNAKDYLNNVIKPRSEKAKVITKDREQRERREDKESADYWKDKNKEREATERKKEKAEPDREPRPRGRPPGGGRGRAPGLEIPKQGLHRFGHATAGLDHEMFQGGKSLNTYADPFSMGTEMSGMASARGNRTASDEMSVNFGMLGPGLSLSGLGMGGVGNAKKAMKRDGNARGFGNYQDPFSGSAPAPRGIGSKTRGRPPKKKQKKEKQPRSLFNLRLF
jgi:hypothetical protein